MVNGYVLSVMYYVLRCSVISAGRDWAIVQVVFENLIKSETSYVQLVSKVSGYWTFFDGLLLNGCLPRMRDPKCIEGLGFYCINNFSTPAILQSSDWSRDCGIRTCI